MFRLLDLWVSDGNMKYITQSIICFVILFPLTSYSNDYSVELNGFHLWQLKDGIRKHFGKPYKSIEGEHVNVEVHMINDTSYMAFEYLKKDFKHNVNAVQITGYPTKMIPFRGLTLGDPLKKVLDVTGKPDESKKVEGTPYTIYYFNKHNFSTEK